MRVQIFADIHGDIPALRRAVAVPADIYIAAGDLVTWPAPLAPCAAPLAHLGDRLWILPGNNETDAQVRDFCSAHGFRAFHGKSVAFQGVRFAGLGYSNPTPFDTPGEYTEQELAGHLERLDARDLRVLVCHAPPFGTALDEAAPGLHFGSKAILDHLQARQPEFFFCGHVHEGAGRVERLGGTTGVNVGKAGYLLEL